MNKNKLNIQGIGLSHCLRAEFSAYLVKVLVIEGKSVNVIGAKGTGKTRLLDDLMQCQLPYISLVRINIKAYVSNYIGLIREIHRQLALDGEVPHRLYQLFAGLEKQNRLYLVCFDNYDALLDNTRNHEKYDKDFFDDLNFVNNIGNVSFLCTTIHPHNALPVFIAGESYTSLLELEKATLPELTRKQVISEVERQAEQYNWEWLKANPKEKELLLDSILDHPFPYPRLNFLVGELIRQNEEEMALPFKKRLRRWLREFDKLHQNSLDKRLHRIRTRAEGVFSASGVKEFKIPIISDVLTIIKKLLKLK